MQGNFKWISPWINTTDRCNCNCKYCYVENKPIDMDKKIYNRINDYIFHLIDNNIINYCKYRVAGGEPLLVINKWYDFAIEFLDKINNNGGIEILSNFTIYPNVLDTILIHKNYSNINISIDSVTNSKPFISGKTSSNIVMGNIEELIYRHNNPIFLMTVITDNGLHLPEMAEYVVSKNAKWEIQANKNYEKDYDYKEVNKNIDKVLKIFDKYNYSVKNILYNFCDLGVKRKCENGKGLFGIMSNGDITNCQMQNDKICDVFDDFIYKLSNNSTNKCITNAECLCCPIFDYCHGDCPFKSNDIDRKKYICESMLFYVPKALELYYKQLGG